MIILFKIYSFIFGSLIGSFLNVVIYRLPLNKNIVTPRSACPQCGHKITWYENIPIFSYFFLKGKCSQCKTKISIRYPIVELITGAMSLFIFPNELNIHSLTHYFFYFSIFCIFLAHFFIDLDHHLLLDKLNIYLLAIVLPYVFINFDFSYWAIGATIGFGGTFLITWLFYKLRGQIGLGGGDIKLFGILGLMLGPIGILNNIFLSCFAGAIWAGLKIKFKKMNKDTPLAFGPFIIIVAIIQIYFPELSSLVSLY
jgi:prepilin signal peptidase PulO-like enzyme (type II secretory pathway)